MTRGIYGYKGEGFTQSSVIGNSGNIDLTEHTHLKKQNQFYLPIPPGDNLHFYLDAGNINSYPGTGTTWTDLSGNNNDFTVANPSWNASGHFNLSASATQVTRNGVLGQSNMTLFWVINTTDAQSLMAHQGGGSFLGAYRSGNAYYHANVGGGRTLYRNTTNYGNIYDVIRTGTWILITITDCDFDSTAFVNYQFNQYGSFVFDSGSLRAMGAYSDNLTSSEITNLYNWFYDKGYVA